MGDITFRDSADGLDPNGLIGFFEGWPDPPSPARHMALLRGSHAVLLALDGSAVIGFVTAISDGVLSACIPLLEVRPAYRGRGIGRALVRRMLDRLDHLYMVDLVCDDGLAPFYAPLGFVKLAGMARRNRAALIR